MQKKKKHALFRTCLGNQSWRRLRDSNPSWSMTPLSVFKTDPFNHLGKSPFGGPSRSRHYNNSVMSGGLFL